MPVLTKINTNSIAEDAITGDKFAGDAYLSNTANQNISGTYSENRLYTSDAYTLSGNATVNSHLTLSSVKPTADVVLTAGGAYTITGTGVLSGGSLLAKANTDLTGMTGELGSVVTGSPNLNLTTGSIGSGVTGGSGLDVITVTDQWLINTSRTSGTINGNWVRPWYTGAQPGTYGTAWSNRGGGINEPNTSGHFSFKVTGLYLIFMTVIIREQTGGADANSGVALYVSSDNGSNFYKTIIARTHAQNSPDGANTSASNMGFINVGAITGGSTVKFLLASDSLAGNNEMYGDTATINTNFSIIRLGT